MTTEIENTRLNFEKVTAAYDKDKLETIEEIMDEAFPADERLPMDKLIAMTSVDLFKVHAIVDEGKVVGFVILVSPADAEWVYGFYLAIKASCRGRNYGSRAIKLLLEECKEKYIIGCVEAVVTDCDNYEQRVARVKFYERNGFRISGITFDGSALQKESMTVICSNPEITDEKLRVQIDEIGYLFGGAKYEQNKQLIKSI